MKTTLAGILVLVLTSCAAPAAIGSPSQPPATPSIGASPSPSAAVAPSTPAASPDDELLFAAIQRLTDRVGYAWTWEHGLAKTSDAGATWQPIAVPAAAVQMPSLRFIDEQVGWITGYVDRGIPQVACQQAPPVPAPPCKGVVLRTTDGGRSWTAVFAIPTTLVTGEPVRALQAVDGLRAWIVTPDEPCEQNACPAELRRTTDGGTTWTTLRHDRIAAIRFASASRGWLAIVTADGSVEVQTTSDGGVTWTNAFAARGDLVGLDAASRDVAWFLTMDGAYCTSSNCERYELFRTADGGATWRSLGNPKRDAACARGNLTAPLFASPTRGWLGLNLGAGGAEGNGGILATEDGGMTFACSPAPPNVALVSAADPDHIWAVSIRTSPQTLRASDDGGRTWRVLQFR
jgi:photosystem II stability/assembly factor-like uncharacterized protein